jgi:hypothetical protein
LDKSKRGSAERLAEVNPEPPKHKQIRDGPGKGLLTGVRPGTEEYREARRKYVKAWRLSGRDKYNPTYGMGWSWRKRKNAKEIEMLKIQLQEALKE